MSFTDDDRIPMTMEERTVWVYLSVVVITSGAYFIIMIPRMLHEPINEISWVPTMLWTLGVSIIGTIVATIVASIGGAVASKKRGLDAKRELASDDRDAEIKRYGSRRAQGVLGASMFVTLVLAMTGADLFWIGNAAFLFGTVGALVETTVKIRAYRRGF